MVRPSSLNLARVCDLAPVLSRRFPETNANIERGVDVDYQVSQALMGGRMSFSYDAHACYQWLKANIHAEWIQTAVELRDDTGSIITQGTPDYVGVDTWDPSTVVVVDLKKREQYDLGKIPPPDSNLQLHAYALATVRRLRYPKYRLALLLFGDGEAEAVWSKREYTKATWTPILDEIQEICTRSELGYGKDPLGKAGPHCLDCYPRKHCPQWALPAHQGESALAPLLNLSELTDERAGQGYLVIKALREMADRGEEILKAHRRAGGQIIIGDKSWEPTIQKGHRYADVEALARDGLRGYIRHGKAREVWRLVKRRSPE